MEGDANGAPHFPDDTPYRKKFSGKYAYRLITAGVGHNLPQEAPQAFAQAVVDADRLRSPAAGGHFVVGTFEKSRDVRCSVAIEGNPDMSRTSNFGSD